MDKSNDFLEKIGRIFSLAMPMAGSQIINVGGGFLCMSMLAHLGHTILAASALIYALQLSIMVTGMSVLFSLSVLIGHAYGAKQYAEVGTYLQQGWLLSLILTVPVIIILWNLGALLIFLGQSPEIAGIVQDYFHIYVWAVLPWFWCTCNQQCGYGVNQKWLMLLSSLLSMGILLIVAYLFIFGKGGMPKMGVSGLAYGVLAQSLFFLLFTSILFYFGKGFKQFELFRYRIDHHWKYFKTLFSVGWPISMQMGGEMLSFSVIMILIGYLGADALAASQIVNQYYFLVIIPIFAFSQASGILVGHACGAKQFHEVKMLGYASMSLVLFFSSLVWCAFIFMPKYLASAYINISDPINVTTLHLLTLLFAVIAFSQLFDGIRNVLVGLLRGLFDTRFAMITGLIVIWCVGVPLSYILGFTFSMGLLGIALGGLCGMIIGTVILFYRWHRLSRTYN